MEPYPNDLFNSCRRTTSRYGAGVIDGLANDLVLRDIPTANVVFTGSAFDRTQYPIPEDILQVDI